MSELSKALSEWTSKRRRRGCVSATAWLCKRLPEFGPIRLGNKRQHVVAVSDEYLVDLTAMPPALYPLRYWTLAGACRKALKEYLRRAP